MARSYVRAVAVIRSGALTRSDWLSQLAASSTIAGVAGSWAGGDPERCGSSSRPENVSTGPFGPSSRQAPTEKPCPTKWRWLPARSWASNTYE